VLASEAWAHGTALERIPKAKSVSLQDPPKDIVIHDRIWRPEELFKHNPHSYTETQHSRQPTCRSDNTPRIISVKKNSCMALSMADGPPLYGFTSLSFLGPGAYMRFGERLSAAGFTWGPGPGVGEGVGAA
jgi:hypothetical protein